MRPSVTMQPAIMPSFGTLNSSRTWAEPSRCFLEGRLEQADHGLLDLLGHVVDDRVQADVDVLALGDVGRIAVGADVEADDDGVAGRGEQHVELVDGADAGMDDADLDLVVAQLQQRVGQHFGRALHVGLDDERQVLDAAFRDRVLQRFQRQSAALGAERLDLGLLLAEERDLPRLGRIGDDWNVSPGCGSPVRPRTSTGVDGPASLVGRSAVVDQRADLADHRAGDEVVADAQRAVLHEHRRDRDRGPCRAWLRARCPSPASSGSP